MRMCVCNVCKFSIISHVCEVFYVSCDYIRVFVYLLQLVGCVLSCVVCCMSCSRIFAGSFFHMFMAIPDVSYLLFN
jgi:hypothetical protein